VKVLDKIRHLQNLIYLTDLHLALFAPAAAINRRPQSLMSSRFAAIGSKALE
jgi:hypothetical protein